MGLANLIKAILNDENEILTVSTYLDGQYGQKDMYIGAPTIINSKGAKEILELALNEEEQEKFNNSCDILREMRKEIDSVI